MRRTELGEDGFRFERAPTKSELNPRFKPTGNEVFGGETKIEKNFKGLINNKYASKAEQKHI